LTATAAPPAFDAASEHMYNEMARGCGAGVGRDILYGRGLAEWLAWLGRAAEAGSTGQGCIFKKHEMAGDAEDIVVLFANIMQEAICHGV